MISISRLMCNHVGPGDNLRYANPVHGVIQANNVQTAVPRPVVVWNCTRRCNLSCLHCYASASHEVSTEMDTVQGKSFIGELADFGVPVILFSGGEPLLRQDLFELAEFASKRKIRVSLSTNGTLITAETAGRMKDIGFAEVGISLDGTGQVNDKFRGKEGAFVQAVQGIKHCISHGLRVSLRLTITDYSYGEIPAIFRLAEDEGIQRICFYHLAYSGRGKGLAEKDISLEQARRTVDEICDHTVDLYKRGLPKEILTVGNHADGIYVYQKMKRSGLERAGLVYDLLKTNGGNNSGIKIAAVDETGGVHPDQFWQHYTLGNVTARKFGDIWADASEPLLGKLRHRKTLLKGKCSRCSYVDLCNGNLRVRAEAVYDDLWAEDPACYLTEEEIAS